MLISSLKDPAKVSSNIFSGGKSGRPFGGRLSLSSFKDKPGLGSQNSLAGGGGGAGGNARGSYRGSVEPEVESSGSLQKHALYIFGEKSQVKGVNVEKHSKADFIPVEYPEPKRLRASFRKLMRACAPSTLQQGGELAFHKQVGGGFSEQRQEILSHVEGGVQRVASTLADCDAVGWCCH